MSLFDALTLPEQKDAAASDVMIGRMLQSVRQHLGMDVAYVSEFVGGESVYQAVDAPGLESLIKAGDRRSLDDVYCTHILAGRLPEIMPDTALFPLAASLPITRDTPIGAHVSVPLRLADGSVHGMFCCLSPHPEPSLNARDLQVMRAFADLAAQQIGRDRAARGEVSEKRERIERLIREGGMEIHLQPIFDFARPRPAGFECLARFTAEPRRSPDKWFLEAAELGLGVEMELAAIRLALKTGNALPRDVYLTVNASAEALLSEGLEGALQGFPLERLVLELTEHAGVREYGVLAARIDALRDAGAKLAIDDAGSGYSGLQHIVQLRPDLIKLDMTLTRNVDTDQARRALAAAFIFYARETGCQILAEGIETEAELATLKALGVHRGQGYLLGKPAPLDQTLRGLLDGAKAA
jgi:EAL domain-containing protein (putative c-di-GMP-specific phosphodiesterase class I)